MTVTAVGPVTRPVYTERIQKGRIISFPHKKKMCYSNCFREWICNTLSFMENKEISLEPETLRTKNTSTLED